MNDENKRNEHQRAFFAEVHNDPYAHMLAKLWAEAWTCGYERATRELVKELTDLGEGHIAKDAWDRVHEADWLERQEMAFDQLTADRATAEAKFLVALAALGPIVAARSKPGTL